MVRRDKLTLAVLCAGHFVNDSYSSIIYPLLRDQAQAWAQRGSNLLARASLRHIVIVDAARLRFHFRPLLQAILCGVRSRNHRSFCLIHRFGALLRHSRRFAGSRRDRDRLVSPASRGYGCCRRKLASQSRMALFSAVGTLGFAVGPMVINPNRFGLWSGNSYYIIGTGLLMSAVLYRVCPPLPAHVLRPLVLGRSNGSCLRRFALPEAADYPIRYHRDPIRLQMTANTSCPSCLKIEALRLRRWAT